MTTPATTPATPATTTPPPTTPAAPLKIDEKTVCNTRELKRLFDDATPLLQRALPASMKKNAERIARCAVTEFQRNPLLAQCTGLSILSCAVQAAQLGLEIGGVMGQCYMVPYNRKIGGQWLKEAQFQVGFRGMIALAFRSGQVAKVYADIVRERDVFHIRKGTEPAIIHEPATKEAGKMLGAYSVVVYTSGEKSIDWMTREEFEHHRDTYSKSWQTAKSPDDKAKTAWGTAFNEMAKKTVLRRHLKQCPFSAEIPAAAFEDERDTPTVTVTAADLVAPASLPASSGFDPDLTERAIEPAAEEKPEEKPEEKTQEPTQEHRVADPPEVLQDAAFLALLDSKKGITWASAIGKVNAKFGSSYDSAVPFEEIALEHRRWVVELVLGLEDAPRTKKK